MSKLKFALAMLAAGGAAGVASEAAAARRSSWTSTATQDFTDIALEGGPAQFYYGFDTTAEKTFLGAYGDSLLLQPPPPKGTGGYTNQQVKTAYVLSLGPSGPPPKYKTVGSPHGGDQFVNLTFSAGGTQGFHGYADIDTGGGLHTINYAAGLSGPVPEPAAWALMIAGFGLTGAALRRSRRQAPLSA